MSGNANVIIPIIHEIVKNDDIDSPKGQYHKWKIGYSHERFTPGSKRLFVWQVNSVADAKQIFDALTFAGMEPHVYEGGQAERIEWVFLYHLS